MDTNTEFTHSAVPESCDLNATDDHGLLFGCRGCGKIPKKVVSPVGMTNISVPHCGGKKCIEIAKGKAIMLIPESERKAA